MRTGKNGGIRLTKRQKDAALDALAQQLAQWARTEFEQGMAEALSHCWKCKAELPKEVADRGDKCPSCGADATPF